ncbi:MAG: Wzz/FepE/Etk N-terminal domain-containing protein [Clostridia bacterium]
MKIKYYLKKLIANWYYIGCIVLLASMLAVVLSEFALPKEYQSVASVRIIIDKSENQAKDANTFVELLKSDIGMNVLFKDEHIASEISKSNISKDGIKDMISYVLKPNSDVITIKVNSVNNSKLADHVAFLVVNSVIPATIEQTQTFKVHAIVISEPSIAKMVAPSTVKNLMVAFVFALFACLGFFAIPFVLGTKIYDEKEFNKNYELPILAVIKFSEREKYEK